MSAFLCFFVFNCSSHKSLPNLEDAKTPLDIVRDGMIGTWTWIKTTGGFAGIIETPSSTGNAKRMKISKDSIKFYKNNALIINSKYIIKNQKSLIFNEERKLLIIEDSERYVIVLNDNTLVLIGDCPDCFSMEFHKE